MVLGLVVVPIAIRGLGAERYGIWLTLASALSFLRVSDLGVAQGLVTELGRSSAVGDDQAIRAWISSAWVLVLAIATLLLLTAAILIPFGEWRHWLHAPAEVLNWEVLGALVIAAVTLAASLPLSLVHKFYVGLQRGYIHSYFALAGNLISVATLLAAAFLAPNLVTLMLALAIAPLFAQCMSAIYAFFWHWPQYKPKFGLAERWRTRELAQTGALFVVLQLSALGVWQTDNLVITHLMGPAAVSRYNVTFQLASTFVGLIGMWLAPLWPAMTEAFARNDLSWVRSTLRRQSSRSLAMTIGGACGILALGRPFVSLWVGPALAPDWGFLVAVAAYMPIFVCCTLATTALKASGKVRGLAAYGLAAAISNVILSLWWGKVLGLVGVCAATSVASFVPAALATLQFHQELKRRSIATKAVSEALL